MLKRFNIVFLFTSNLEKSNTYILYNSLISFKKVKYFYITDFLEQLPLILSIISLSNFCKISIFIQNMFHSKITITSHTSGYIFDIYLVRVNKAICSCLLKCPGNLQPPSTGTTLFNLFLVHSSHFLSPLSIWFFLCNL